MSRTKLGKLGPKMQALNERQQAFVIALLMQGTTNYAQAARAAGYVDGGSGAGLRVQAGRLAHDEKILAAIKEETDRRMRASVGMAAEVLVAIAEDPTHKDRMKAATALLNRGGLHESVEHKVTHDVTLDAKALLARFAVLAGTLGVNPVAILGRAGLSLPPPDAVDGEFVEVGPEVSEPEADLSWMD